jgi:hypothetical protein
VGNDEKQIRRGRKLIRRNRRQNGPFADGELTTEVQEPGDPPSELRVIRIGQSLRVPRAALEGWIVEQRQHAGGRRRGPLLAEVEDRNGVSDAASSQLTRGVPRDPIVGPRGAWRQASSWASS